MGSRLNSSFRLVAADEIWQASDRCRQYQTLACYLTRRPLYASNRKLAGRSAPDNLNGSFRKQRTGPDDPLQSSEQTAWTTEMQRLLPVMPVSRSSGFSQIAVIPSALAAYPQQLVYGEKRTLGCGSAKQALNIRYHGRIQPVDATH